MRSPGPPAHETASAVPPVRSPGLPAHEEDQNKAFVQRERVTFAYGRIVEPFSVARKDCGTLTGCVMALLSLHEEFRLCWQTEIGADGLDF